jgi:hypothetical protein
MRNNRFKGVLKRFRAAGLMLVLFGCGAGTLKAQQKAADSALDKRSATTIEFAGSTAKISGAGAAFSGGTLTIAQPGTYVLSGKLENGQVHVDLKKNDTVRLVLNRVTLRNETGPAIYAPKSKEIVLALEKGTQNTVSDGSKYKAVKDENEPDAAIFVQDSLSISGDGNLAVAGMYKHGIRAQDTLAVTGGVISVNSAGDALRGRDGVNIQNGNFTLKAGGDGIQSNNDKDDAKGFVNIAGGAFVIQSGNDGIQAQSSLTITGGVFQITTGGGSANAPARTRNFRGGFGGGFGPAPKSSNDESVSMKALKAGKLIHIKGGDFTIDAEDDAVHSNDKVVIAGGKFTVRTGDDGFHADDALEISGGVINILACYEGLEGLSITISGGNISVIANEDAVNAADGTANAGGRGPMGRGGRGAINENIYFRITGGTLYLYAPNTDGIDSNGNIFIEGGTIKISGPSMGMEGAMDFDGSLTVTGGEFITAGSILNVSQNSTQPVILVSYARQQPSGSIIAIKDSNGKALLEYTSRIACSVSGFTSPSFKIGGTYYLFINGEKRTDIKLNGIITSIGDNGGYYNGGRGFGGRPGGPGGMPARW